MALIIIFLNGALKFSESLDKCNAKQAPNKSIVSACVNFDSKF